MIRSSGILPAMNKSTRRGMKSRGRLSPWMTPRTVRPPCSHGISKLTSVPARALPTRTQMPRPRKASTARRQDIEHGAGAGLQAAAKRPEEFDRRVAAQFYDVLRRRKRECREGRLLEKAGIDGGGVAAHRCRAVGAAATRFERPRIRAIGN